MSHIKLNNGADLIFSSQFPNPGDWYLHTVLAKFNGQWVTWVHNEIDGGCHSGHYSQRLLDALRDYYDRVEAVENSYAAALAEQAEEQAMHEASIAAIYEGVAQ